MSMHLTKEELQECQRASWEGEESKTEVGGFRVWMDYDRQQDFIVLNYDDGNETPYLEGKGKWDASAGPGKFIFLEGIDFEPYSHPYGITLSVSELEAVNRDRGCDHLEGWTLETHTDGGDFDAEKGAMTDFEVSLYNADGDYMGTGSGRNYYTAVSGVHFYESIDFEKPEPPSKAELFSEAVINSMYGTNDIKTKIWSVKKVIEKYESGL